MAWQGRAALLCLLPTSSGNCALSGTPWSRVRLEFSQMNPFIPDHGFSPSPGSVTKPRRFCFAVPRCFHPLSLPSGRIPVPVAAPSLPCRLPLLLPGRDPGAGSRIPRERSAEAGRRGVPRGCAGLWVCCSSREGRCGAGDAAFLGMRAGSCGLMDPSPRAAQRADLLHFAPLEAFSACLAPFPEIMSCSN